MLTTSAPVDADVLRLRSEFRALPGLRLTTVQTARLLSIREPQARQLLDSLVDDGFLIHTVSGVYRRPPPDVVGSR